MLYKRQTWGVYCTCLAHAQNLHLVLFFSSLNPKPIDGHGSKLMSRQPFRRGAGAIVVAGAGPHKKTRARGGNVITMGSSEFVKC